MKRLYIAEKPDMGRQIASALAQPHKKGDGFIETGEGTVTWCVGHIMQMAQPEEYSPDWKIWKWDNLPMIPETWKLDVIADKSRQFKIIKDLLKQTDDIVNAGDPGREGQLIVDEVLHHLNNRKPVKRILLHALDHQSVREAIDALEDNQKFFPLYQAGLGRGYADWLMGLNATRAYTLLGQKNGYKGVLSVGRVQSPTLAIVVRRDELIENFKSQDYYLIVGHFKNKEGLSFKAWWKPQENTNPLWLDEEQRLKDRMAAQTIATKVTDKPAQIISYEEKEGKESPPPPYTLSAMQSYASSKWGMSAKKVLDTCQTLYDKHYQSYPRTDCPYLPENQHKEAPVILAHIAQSIPTLTKAAAGADPSIKGPVWNDKKLDDHYGLIPTRQKADMAALNPDEQKIYQAVCERYVAQFYPVCIFKAAVVELDCEQERFKATGRVILEKGWRAVFAEDKEEDAIIPDEDEQVFPNIAKGDSLHCAKGDLQAKQTKPPGRFTDGTLIKAMANVHTLVTDPDAKKRLKDTKGIGREATRVAILETLIKRTFLERKGKQLISTPTARTLIHALPPRVVDPALTALWENALEQIATGQLPLEVFLQKQIAWVKTLIEQAKTVNLGPMSNTAGSATSSGSSKGATGTGTSKTSGKNINKTSSKNITKKVSPKTTNYAATKNTSKVSAGEKCPACGTGNMKEKTAKASGKIFLGCDKWPACNHTQW